MNTSVHLRSIDVPAALSDFSHIGQLLIVLSMLLPMPLFGGWSQEITGGAQGNDIPATVDSPKLYHVGTEALPFDMTQLPVMYPEDRLWFDVRDKKLVLDGYIREVVNNRYLNLHKWEIPQDYFAPEPAPGKLDRDYLKALHARMAFFAKLLQMSYTVGSDASHTKANTSIMWADYNNMVNHAGLSQSNGVGISFPGWIQEQDKLDFWKSHYPDMNTNLISGPGVNFNFQQASDYVNPIDLPIDPTDFLVLSPHQIALELVHHQPTVWSLSDSRNAARVNANYGTLPQDRAYSPLKPLAYSTNKSFPFIGHTPSTWTPDTWYFATGRLSTKPLLIEDEETRQWKKFWEPHILGILSSSQWELLDSTGKPVNLHTQYVGNMVGFTPLNEQGSPVNLGRGIPDGAVRSYTVRGRLILEVRWMKEGDDPYIEAVPYNVQYTVHLVGTEQMDYVVWPNEEQIAYGIKSNPQWGCYNTTHYPWIWRYDTQDWAYMADRFVREDDQKNFFYSQKEQAWVFSSAKAAPFAYHFGKHVWITF